MSDFEGLDIEDIVNKKNTKKVNGNKKGKRTERQIVQKLKDRFGEGFSRSVGSGNRWAQTSYLPEHAKQTFTGDICCPEGFLWIFECKGGYSEIDIHNFFANPNAEFEGFLAQAENDGKTVNKKPVVIWKKDRKPILAIYKQSDLTHQFNPCMLYKDWCIVNFDDFLKLPDNIFIQNH